MEDFEKFKEQHILEAKKLIKQGGNNLKELESAKKYFSKITPLTPQQIEKLSKKKKKVWAESLENYERLLSLEETAKTNLELSKRQLKAYKSAKKMLDMLELTCQECGEHIFGMVCDLCGYNNSINIVEMAKKEILVAEKHGAPVGEKEKALLEKYENLEMEKKKNEEVEQFILNALNTWASCEACGKLLGSTICEKCGVDNAEHKDNIMKQMVLKMIEYYNISPEEASKALKVKIQKLTDEG